MPNSTASIHEYRLLRVEAIKRMLTAIAEGRHEHHAEAAAEQAHEMLGSLGKKLAAKKAKQEAKALSEALDDYGFLTRLKMLLVTGRRIVDSKIVEQHAAVKARNFVAKVADALGTRDEKPARAELEMWNKYEAPPLTPGQEYAFKLENISNDLKETQQLRITPKLTPAEASLVTRTILALHKEVSEEPQSLARIAKQELEKKRGKS